MTTVADAETSSEADPTGDISVIPDPPRPGRSRAERVALTRRVTILGALALVVLLGLYAFFGAFVTHLWYESRQRALGAQGLSLVKARVGQPVGVLQAEGPFQLNTVLVQGDGTDELRAGPGHEVGTPLPGSVGNSVIWGHADEWGAPFEHLKSADKGMELYLRTPAGVLLGYDVVKTAVVPASALGPYLGRSTDYRLTLVTDAGGRWSDRRLVVVAVSGTVGHATPASKGTPLGPDRTSPLGAPLLEVLGWSALCASVVLLLRHRLSRAALVLAAAPVAVAGLVALFLEIGLLWNPLA